MSAPTTRPTPHSRNGYRAFRSIPTRWADNDMSKPKILVARAIFPETIERLSQHFEVESNQTDESWSKEQLIAKLQGKQGAFTTGSERIDAAVLDACPDLKICANMSSPPRARA